MSQRQFFFLSGIPRSGSTILRHVLHQNPAIHASGTSGLFDLVTQTRKAWDRIVENHALDWETSETKKLNVLRALFHGYYAEIERPVVIDKYWYWPSEIELLSRLHGTPKILVTIRDMRDVLASWEMLHRKNPTMHHKIKEKYNAQAQTIEGRLQIYAKGDEPIGKAFNVIKDAIQRGLRRHLYFVRFEDLTRDPQRTLEGIYQFLELDPYPHDFEHIETAVLENDRVWGFKGLHAVDDRIRPARSRWQEVLGPAGEQYYIDWDALVRAS